MRKMIPLVVAATLFLLMDLYVFEAIKVVFPVTGTYPWVQYLFWLANLVAIAGFFIYHLTPIERVKPGWRQGLLSGLLMAYFAKFFVLLFVLFDDARRLFQWSGDQLSALWNTRDFSPAMDNPRSDMIARAGLLAATVPVSAMAYGVLVGAHDYRVVRKKIVIPHLPDAMEGITIGQISDIHAGSLYNRRGVMRGISKLLQAQPDLVAFTGDLVNSRADEVEPIFDLLEQVTAPLGVYSILGNHDYGDYAQWDSPADKQANLEVLYKTHEWLGWRLLRNESDLIDIGGEKLAIIGVENWGQSSRMPKLGNLAAAKATVQDAGVKILLSHDPSHWSQVVLPHHPDIDLTLSGHTHGMQFGLHTKRVKWSPVQYHIRHWAGHYREGHQQLYVNRGFGFHGFPGRIGMPPEITILTLTKG